MKQPRETSAGYLFNHLARLFAQALQERIQPLGLSIGVFPIMLHLWEEEGLTQKQLVQRVGIEQGTMANTLKRMERDGLVVSQRDLSDGRRREIRLTEHGRSLRSPALRIAEEQNTYMLSGLTKEEQAEILNLVTKIIRSVERSAISEKEARADRASSHRADGETR
ncbi:MarR family transcriptional regulator [Phaeobacter inhibens]|uniref:MarR family winged helix-turn-helix transcriptional regulator n=1 Tax=Phaeobacter inhibens TaxID=221822 RepID=UPI0021A3069D|nr:MarR family transcriptional regulator [Phaeobacter inhibens]UWR67594.1 MarR family transcriptional regulator [Phaeobacter inhibens]